MGIFDRFKKQEKSPEPEPEPKAAPATTPDCPRPSGRWRRISES